VLDEVKLTDDLVVQLGHEVVEGAGAYFSQVVSKLGHDGVDAGYLVAGACGVEGCRIGQGRGCVARDDTHIR